MRLIAIELKANSGEGKTILFDWVGRHLLKLGAQLKITDEEKHMGIIVIPDDTVFEKIIAPFPKDGELINGMATMRLNAEEVRLIEDHRLSKLW